MCHLPLSMLEADEHVFGINVPSDDKHSSVLIRTIRYSSLRNGPVVHLRNLVDRFNTTTGIARNETATHPSARYFKHDLV